MSVRMRWTIFILICVIGIALLTYRQVSRAALFNQVASNNMGVRVAATKILLDKKIIPGAFPAQSVIVRNKVSKALAKIGTPEAIAALINLLSDIEDDPRRFAKDALVELGEPALPALTQVLSEGDANSQKKAIEGLSEIGAPAIPYVRMLLTDAATQASACLILGNIGADKKSSPQIAQEALEPLINSILAADTTLANAAIPILSDKKVVAAVEPLRQALKVEALRANALSALGDIGDARATLDLIPYIANKNLRVSAVRALGKIADPRAAAPLVATLAERDRDYRSALTLALQKIGTPAAELLIGYLKSPDVYVRRAAAQALWGDAVPNSIPALRQALLDKSEDMEVRAAAAAALGWPQNTAAIETLLIALHDPEGRVVDAAVNSFAAIGPSAIPALMPLFVDPDPTYALYASHALVKMGDAAAPALMQALDSPQQQVQLWASITLADLGYRQAIPQMIQLYEHSQGNFKWAVAQGLRKLGATLPAVAGAG